MSFRPALYRAEWVLPVSSPPIRDGAILVDTSGRIAAVGPSSAVDGPEQAERIDVGRAILLPGLVNVHAHPELSIFRGALEDLPFRDWILRLVGAKRAVLRDEDFLAGARWTMIEAMRAGITTLGATEASGAAAQALDESGLRGVLYQEVFGPDPGQAGAAMEELEDALARRAAFASDRVRIGVSPHAPYTVSDELYRSVTRLALERGLPMALHIAESEAESLLVGAGGGDFAPGLRTRGISTSARAASPLRLLQRLGVLDAKPLLIHCVRLDPDEIELLAGTGCAVAHCPVANSKLGHGVAPIVEMRAAGATVGLGTDSVASNNRLDLLEEARIAALLQRARTSSPASLSSEELLRMCTLDGARALAWEDRIGSLEPGKDADLCAVSLDGPHTQPVFDPLATLFHSARASDVVLTVVRGRVLWRDGRLTSLDVEAVATAVESAASRLRELR